MMSHRKGFVKANPEISGGAAVAHPGREEEEGLSRDGILALQYVPAPVQGERLNNEAYYQAPRPVRGHG